MGSMDEIQAVFQVKDRETLKVLADPLRAQIVETLLSAPQTVKQVADKLGLTPGNLYYHFNLLEKHGLILVAETRMVANMLERVYRAAAKDISLDPNLFALGTVEGKESFFSIIRHTIDTTREDLLRSLNARFFQLDQGAAQKPRQVILTRCLAHIPEKRAVEFQRRLKEIIHDFEAAEVAQDAPGAKTFAMTVVMYPSFYFNDEIAGDIAVEQSEGDEDDN